MYRRTVVCSAVTLGRQVPGEGDQMPQDDPEIVVRYDPARIMRIDSAGTEYENHDGVFGYIHVRLELGRSRLVGARGTAGTQGTAI